MEIVAEVVIDPKLIREAREEKRIAQSDAARMLGISRQRLYAYETGNDKLPGDILARICLLYGKSVANLTLKKFADKIT